VRNVRSELRGEGLVRSVPEKDAEGEVRRWFVTLTGAGEIAARTTTLQIPSTRNLSGSGLFTPDPEFCVSGSGASRDLADAASPPDFVTPFGPPGEPFETLDAGLRDPAFVQGLLDDGIIAGPPA
jgi:hypothetical protein